MDKAPAVRRRLIALPRTIRGLTVTFAIVSALATVLLGRVTYRLVHEELERQIDDRIDVETRALVEYDRIHGFEALLAVVRQRDKDAAAYVTGVDPSVGRAMGYIVTDRDGTRRAGALRATMPPPGYTEFVHFTRDDGTSGVAQGMNSPLPEGGRLLVAVDRSVIAAMDASLFRLFAAAFGGLLLFGFALTIGLGKVVQGRLAAFERLASSITAGDIKQRMPRDGTGVEFDRLALLLNQMLDRISALVANLREVSTGLAHDLRTPLSRVRSRIERIEAATIDEASSLLLEDAVRDIDNLLELFGGLLAVSELGGHSIRSRFSTVDLAAAVREIAEAHRPAIEDNGRTLHIDVVPTMVFGDRSLLQRLVGNLLDNAMVHTQPGTAVDVTLRLSGDNALLRVADSGPGIPAADRTRVFDRLVRLDPSRSGPGHGLGLSMVSAIVAAHDGQVGVLPSSRGFVIEVKLQRTIGVES